MFLVTPHFLKKMRTTVRYWKETPVFSSKNTYDSADKFRTIYCLDDAPHFSKTCAASYELASAPDNLSTPKNWLVKWEYVWKAFKEKFDPMKESLVKIIWISCPLSRFFYCFLFSSHDVGQPDWNTDGSKSRVLFPILNQSRKEKSFHATFLCLLHEIHF